MEECIFLVFLLKDFTWTYHDHVFFLLLFYDFSFLEDFFSKEIVQTNYAQLVMTWSQQDCAQEISTEMCDWSLKLYHFSIY